MQPARRVWRVWLRCLDCVATHELTVSAKMAREAERAAVEQWDHDRHGTFHGRAVGQAVHVEIPKRARPKITPSPKNQPRLL